MTSLLKTDITLTNSGFLFNHSTGLTYSLNATGLFIFQQLQDEQEVDQILQRLMEEFLVDEDTARKDLDDYLRQLQELGLVE